jgi:hypothetical protein
MGVNIQVDPGAHQVCFGPVASHSAPPCQLVTTSVGSPTTVTGTFDAPTTYGYNGDGIRTSVINSGVTTQESWNNSASLPLLVAENTGAVAIARAVPKRGRGELMIWWLRLALLGLGILALGGGIALSKRRPDVDLDDPSVRLTSLQLYALGRQRGARKLAFPTIIAGALLTMIGLVGLVASHFLR